MSNENGWGAGAAGAAAGAGLLAGAAGGGDAAGAASASAAPGRAEEPKSAAENFRKLRRRNKGLLSFTGVLETCWQNNRRKGLPLIDCHAFE